MKGSSFAAHRQYGSQELTSFFLLLWSCCLLVTAKQRGLDQLPYMMKQEATDLDLFVCPFLTSKLWGAEAHGCKWRRTCTCEEHLRPTQLVSTAAGSSAGPSQR